MYVLTINLIVDIIVLTIKLIVDMIVGPNTSDKTPPAYSVVQVNLEAKFSFGFTMLCEASL